MAAVAAVVSVVTLYSEGYESTIADNKIWKNLVQIYNVLNKNKTIDEDENETPEPTINQFFTDKEGNKFYPKPQTGKFEMYNEGSPWYLNPFYLICSSLIIMGILFYLNNGDPDGSSISLNGARNGLTYLFDKVKGLINFRYESKANNTKLTKKFSGLQEFNIQKVHPDLFKNEEYYNIAKNVDVNRVAPQFGTPEYHEMIKYMEDYYDKDPNKISYFTKTNLDTILCELSKIKTEYAGKDDPYLDLINIVLDKINRDNRRQVRFSDINITHEIPAEGKGNSLRKY